MGRGERRGGGERRNAAPFDRPRSGAVSVTRLAVVVTHPIQYYAPLWRALAREASLRTHVIFASRIGLEKTFDAEMKAEVAWATDLTAGYSHEFLPEAASI